MVGKWQRDPYRIRPIKTTIDLNQAAASYDLFTGVAQDCALAGLMIKMATGNCGGSLTSIAIQTDDATPAVLISSTTGAVGNLTTEAVLAWTGLSHIAVGTKIQLTIAGGSHGTAYSCKVTAFYRAITNGGKLT
jgi:hypothetical protein